MKKSIVLVLFLLFFTLNAFAAELPETLAIKAISDESTESNTAIEELRSMGPRGLQTLLEKYEPEIQAHVVNPNLGSSEKWQRISSALDAVSQQKNSYLSGLYWYTNLDDAKKAAAATGKPILSLRLLGRLTDELSCANSRFFRTVLYPNNDISSILRERFVLHWESVRPAPVITIDFGDGRKLERTVTGNSIHYVLDSNGRLLDAIPGLYGPKAFAQTLDEAESIFKKVVNQPENVRSALLLNYYEQRINKISVAWLADNTKIGGKPLRGVQIMTDQNGEALAILPLAYSKALSERTMLQALTVGPSALGKITDEEAWQKIARLHSNDSKLDERSVSLITRQNKSLSPNELQQLIAKFQDAVSIDTVRNEYLLRPTLYAWLTTEIGRDDLRKFNEKVYAELFLTPSSDPWLGLRSTYVYTGLDNGGIIEK